MLPILDTNQAFGIDYNNKLLDVSADHMMKQFADIPGKIDAFKVRGRCSQRR